MTITEAASVYKVSEGALYRLLRQGRLTRYRRGADRRTYLSIEQLDRELRPRPEER